jgi:hypothetical protein
MQHFFAASFTTFAGYNARIPALSDTTSRTGISVMYAAKAYFSCVPKGVERSAGTMAEHRRMLEGFAKKRCADNILVGVEAYPSSLSVSEGRRAGHSAGKRLAIL